MVHTPTGDGRVINYHLHDQIDAGDDGDQMERRFVFEGRFHIYFQFPGFCSGKVLPLGFRFESSYVCVPGVFAGG